MIFLFYAGHPIRRVWIRRAPVTHRIARQVEATIGAFRLELPTISPEQATRRSNEQRIEKFLYILEPHLGEKSFHALVKIYVGDLLAIIILKHQETAHP